MTFQTFTPREYLKIDIANNFGLGKKNWSDRIKWFDLNEPNLESMLKDAKEPALFYAGVKAWRDVQAGKPIGYMVSLDATASGLQLLAALTGDRSAAQLCNVVDTGTREDAYDGLYDEMRFAINDPKNKVSPEKSKKAIMTAFYNSKAVPKEIFGEGPMLNVFYQVLEKMAPGAWQLNQFFPLIWNSKATEHCWILPDNFHVRTKVKDTIYDRVSFLGDEYVIPRIEERPAKEGKSLGPNTIHSIDGMIVREMVRRCSYNPAQIKRIRELLLGRQGVRVKSTNDIMVQTLWSHYQDSGYLSARILDHLTVHNIGLVKHKPIIGLLDSLPEKPFEMITIHDCFKCLPTYGNDMRHQYNIQLALVAKSNLLSWLLSQIAGEPIPVAKLDPTLYRDIVETNYALS